MIVYRILQHVSWFLKFLQLKLLFGKRIQIHMSDRIAPSVRFRINGSGSISLGECVEIRENVILNVSNGGHIVIGDYVFINDGCCINSRKRITIGNNTMLGQGVKVYDHDHDYLSTSMRSKFKEDPVEIGANSWICSNVIVLKGVCVGLKSVIAAGTLLKSNVPSNVLVYNRIQTVYKNY